jgi:hypothetical protein
MSTDVSYRHMSNFIELTLVEHTGQLGKILLHAVYFFSSETDDWWLAKNVNTKQTGYVPRNYIVLDDDSVESQE